MDAHSPLRYQTIARRSGNNVSTSPVNAISSDFSAAPVVDQSLVSALQSGVLSSPADAMLRDAIALTLGAQPCVRAALFEGLISGIEAFMAARVNERPWTCRVFSGTDGARVFRGGVGHSLVIDPAGRLWRARSYEDFHTTYAQVENAFEIATLTPLYAQMLECVPAQSDDRHATV